MDVTLFHRAPQHTIPSHLHPTTGYTTANSRVVPGRVELGHSMSSQEVVRGDSGISGFYDLNPKLDYPERPVLGAATPYSLVIYSHQPTQQSDYAQIHHYQHRITYVDSHRPTKHLSVRSDPRQLRYVLRSRHASVKI